MDNQEPIRESFQQGDVTFRRVSYDSNAPRQLSKPISKGRCVVAEGEGHHIHVIDAPDTDAELIKEGERMLLLLHKPATVRHEIVNQPGSQADHLPRTLAPGLWEIGNVREVDHFAQQERRVVD
jgi:hypothetical protein